MREGSVPVNARHQHGASMQQLPFSDGKTKTERIPWSIIRFVLVTLLLGRPRVCDFSNAFDVAGRLNRFFGVFPGTNDMVPGFNRMVRRLLVLSRVVMCCG